MLEILKENMFALLNLLSNLCMLIMQALSLPPEYVRRLSMDTTEYEDYERHSRSSSIQIADSNNTQPLLQSNPTHHNSQHQHNPKTTLNSKILNHPSSKHSTITPDHHEDSSTIEESNHTKHGDIEVVIPIRLKERLSNSSLKSCKSESCLRIESDFPINSSKDEPDETPKGRRESPSPQYLKLPTSSIEKSIPHDKFHQHLMKKTFVLKKSFSENQHSSIELHNRLLTFKFPPSSSTSELCNYD